MRNAKLVNYLHLHGIVFIWGFTAVLGALISIDAIPLVWYRMLIASVLLLGYLMLRRQKFKVPKKAILSFCIVGLLLALHWMAFFGAIKLSNVSITLAVMSTGAFFTSFLEPLLFKRKLVGYEVLFGILVVAGLYIIFSFEANYVTGILLALASSFLGALFNVLNGKFVQRYQATVISLYELGFGMLCISVYLLFSGSFDAELFQLSNTDWILIFILASVCTAYAFIASVHVMKWISPYTVMLTINLEPVYGIVLALIILGDKENMSPQFYYGALVILVTVLANGVIKMKRERKNKGGVQG